MILPILLGDGVRLTPALSPDTGLAVESQRALPGGSAEIVYAIGKDADGSAAHDPDWAPRSQRRDR